jgi:hypothetical protein
MKIILGVILTIHGLIHSLGFIKAFFPEKITQLKQPISEPIGWLWLLTGLSFLVGCIMLVTNRAWWIAIIVALLLSQILIIQQWADCKFGTIINILLLLICIPAIATWKFERNFRIESSGLFIDSSPQPLTEMDIKHLPEPVQKYIRKSGALGRPKVKNFKLEFTGRIRQDEESEWMPFTTEQVNSIDLPVRLFFMKATMKQLPVAGYHTYNNGKAIMDIRLLSLLPVQYQSGRIMDVSETVTWFNDLCLFAPAALIDNRIEWQPIDSLSTLVTFTHNDISISAKLIFDAQGQLVNFISNDRYRIVSKTDHSQQQFSTPIQDYTTLHGFIIPHHAAAVWNLPKGDLTYGEFTSTNIQYNLQK